MSIESNVDMVKKIRDLYDTDIIDKISDIITDIGFLKLSNKLDLSKKNKIYNFTINVDDSRLERTGIKFINYRPKKVFFTNSNTDADMMETVFGFSKELKQELQLNDRCLFILIKISGDLVSSDTKL